MKSEDKDEDLAEVEKKEKKNEEDKKKRWK
jgi:hypothetical protein